MGNQTSAICGCKEEIKESKDSEHIVVEYSYRKIKNDNAVNDQGSERTRKGFPGHSEGETAEHSLDTRQGNSNKSYKTTFPPIEEEKRNGYYTIKDPNGMLIYEGYFKDDLYDSEGTLNMGNSLIYQGNFLNGKREGKGILYSTIENFKYEGDWLDDKKCGKGVIHYPDGSYYIGEFANDMRNGKGTWYLSDGSCYDGEFNDDKLEGYGKYTWSRSVDKVYEGQWKNNSLNGVGVLCQKGSIFIGSFLNDKKNGVGCRIMPENNDIVGCFKDNKLNGLVLKINKETESMQFCIMENNILNHIQSQTLDVNKIKFSNEFKVLIKFYENNFGLIEKYRNSAGASK